MRRLACLGSLIFIFVLPAAAIAASEVCPLVDFHGQAALLPGGTLSPQWAQEYIGADLARDEMISQAGLVTVPVGVIDGGFSIEALNGAFTANLRAIVDAPGFSIPRSGHGTKVANLLNGPAPYGVGVYALMDALATHQSDSFYLRATQEMLQSQVKIVNISQGAAENPLIEKNLNQLSADRIVVAAAGNSYPAPLEGGIRKLNGIIVGSISPAGLISAFTQEGDEVTILAPSDEWLKSTYGGAVERLASTSGATPLVAGAIANVISFIPDLDLGEAKLLLNGAAIPTVNAFQVPRRNGAGTLNAYRMVRVAERLRGLSKDGRDVALAKSAAFDFSDEAANDFEEAVRLLGESDCASNQRGFSLLRKSVLLDPSNRRAREALATAYERIGLTESARFYRSLQKEDLEKNIVAGLGSEDENERAAALRTTEFLGKAAVPYLMTALEGPSVYLKQEALGVASGLGRDGVPVFEKALSQSWDSNEVAQIAYAARNLGADGAGFIEKIASGGNPNLRAAALGGVGVLGADRAVALLAAGLEDRDLMVQLGTLRGAATLGGAGVPLLKTAMTKVFQPPNGGSYMIPEGKIPSDRIAPLLADFREEAVPYVRDLLQAKHKWTRNTSVDAAVQLWTRGVRLESLGEPSAKALELFLQMMTTEEDSYRFGNDDYKIIIPMIVLQIRESGGSGSSQTSSMKIARATPDKTFALCLFAALSGMEIPSPCSKSSASFSNSISRRPSKR